MTQGNKPAMDFDRPKPIMYGQTSSSPKGYTMIELLLVIGIIVLVTSSSLIFLTALFKNEGVKEGARVVQMAFAKTRQLAVTQRSIYFLVFEKDYYGDQLGMTIHKGETDKKDEDNKYIYDKALDQEIEKSIILLPKRVQFNQNTPLLKLDQPYITFLSDGSLLLPENIPDNALAHPPTIESSDIVLEQDTRTGKMYLDFVHLTAKIIKMVYYEEEEEEGTRSVSEKQ